MGGKPSKSACEIRGVRIIGVEDPSHSVQIIMNFTIMRLTPLVFRFHQLSLVRLPLGLHSRIR